MPVSYCANLIIPQPHTFSLISSKQNTFKLWNLPWGLIWEKYELSCGIKFLKVWQKLKKSGWALLTGWKRWQIRMYILHCLTASRSIHMNPYVRLIWGLDQNGQVIYIEISKLNIAKMFLASFDCVTFVSKGPFTLCCFCQ